MPARIQWSAGYKLVTNGMARPTVAPRDPPQEAERFLNVSKQWLPGKILVDENARLSQNGNSPKLRTHMIASQIEFPITVAVCAWCKPRLGKGLELISHGICPRHLRRLKQEAQGIAVVHDRSSRRQRVDNPGSLLLPL